VNVVNDVNGSAAGPGAERGDRRSDGAAGAAGADGADGDAASAPAERPEGFRRVAQALAERGHPHAPRWLDSAARTAQQAADLLGVAVGQIAKSVIFRRRADDAAVLVITSGDLRVDEALVSRHTGALGRADAAFVKSSTGFSIGGVAPLAHRTDTMTLIDRELFRFEQIWAAAGHPNGVFLLSPHELVALTGAPVEDVTQAAASEAVRS
jgi:prolyl-tRNA editing enzyme YbaK/EbsC (Cys-tRNA(Pro) deacylase)